MIGQHELKPILPHRYPMLLVDRVDSVEVGRGLVATKAISCNEPWFQDIPDDAPESAYAYPVPLVIESWCQSAGILALWGRDEPPNPDTEVMLFGAISDVEVHRSVFPGDILTHRVRLTRTIGETIVFEGECLIGSETVLDIASIVVTTRPADVLRPPTSEPQALGVAR